MRIVFLFVLIAIVMTGCTGLIERGERAIKEGTESARSVHDGKLKHTEDFYCNGQSTGAVSRVYGPLPAIWAGYWNLCNDIRSLTGSIVVPPIPDDIPVNP